MLGGFPPVGKDNLEPKVMLTINFDKTYFDFDKAADYCFKNYWKCSDYTEDDKFYYFNQNRLHIPDRFIKRKYYKKQQGVCFIYYCKESYKNYLENLKCTGY